MGDNSISFIGVGNIPILVDETVRPRETHRAVTRREHTTVCALPDSQAP